MKKIPSVVKFLASRWKEEGQKYVQSCLLTAFLEGKFNKKECQYYYQKTKLEVLRRKNELH